MSRTWDQESAIAELDQLLEQSKELEGELPRSERLTAWAFRVTDFLTDVFGQDSSYYKSWARISWKPTGGAVIGGPARPDESWDPQLGIERLQREAVAQALGTCRGIPTAGRKKLESEPDVASLHESKDTAPEASLLIKAINLAEHKLRKVMRDPPADEKALQD